MQPQRRAGVVDQYPQGVRGVSLTPVLGAVDQDAHSGPAVQGVDFEEVEGTQRPPSVCLDDQAQLTALEQIVALRLDQCLQRVPGERGERAADAPDRRVVLPGVEQVDIAGLQRPQPAEPALQIDAPADQSPMILLRINMAEPQALAVSVIFDTRNLVSL